MDSPTDSSIDDFAARATVNTYGDISIIAIPDVETLSESEHIAALKKAEHRLISGHPDPDALRVRLQAITPPPDEEEDNEESRLLEAQARQDLESDGCPACYPPHLDVPVRNPPEEYRRIIEYWQSFSSTGDVVLCAQRSDWRLFRESQQRLRDRYRNKSFSTFVDKARERGEGLDDNVHLLLDSQQQCRQQNWIEFQDYHLIRHERQKKKRDGLQKDLDDAQEGAGNTDIEGSERAAQHERAIQRRLEYAERTLRWHGVILWWIEQRRLAMDPGPPTPVEKGSGDQNTSTKAVRRASIRQRQSERPNTSAVLGKVRVLKPTPKSQNIRTQTVKTKTSKPIIVDLDVTIPSSTQQIPKRREIKPRCARYPMPIEEEDREDRDATLQVVRRSPRITRRKKQLGAPTILGEVRVSKAKRRKRNTPRQQRKTTESESAIKGLDTPERSIPQASKRRESKPRRTETERPLRQLRPQRVSKTKRFTDTNAKFPQRARQRRSPDQARSSSRQSPQRPRPPHVDIKTRLGRVSRRPERWCFPPDGQTL